MSRDLDKALKDYEEIFGRPTPVRYNVLYFNDEHRRMDALLRRHYEAFHPLVRDIFTSFSLEFSILVEKVENMEEEIEYLIEETKEKQKQLEEEFDNKHSELKSTKETQEQTIKEQTREIEKLNKMVEEQAQLLREKEALIVTQRRQLDVYIDQQTKLQSQQEEQQQQLGESIETVSHFTDQLVGLESQMHEMETQRAELQDENRQLTQNLQEIEDQYIQEISEIPKLYNTLKHETTSLYEKIEKIQSERDKLRSEVDDLKERYEEIETKSITINLDNKTLKDEVNLLERQIIKKDKELTEIREKNKKFKVLANKILQLKDKVDWGEAPAQKIPARPAGEVEKDVRIVHPAQTLPVKKWEPKKTSLEAELEQENGGLRKFESKYKIVEKDVELDTSVFKLQSKLSDTREHDLLSSIKQSIRTTADHLDMTKRLDNEVKKAEDELNERLRVKTVDAEVNTPNLGRLLAKLDSNKVDILNMIADDLPAPPSDVPSEPEKEETTEKPKPKKKKENKDRSPLTG